MGDPHIAVSRRHLLLIVLTAMLGGFIIGYALAFLMWWNR